MRLSFGNRAGLCACALATALVASSPVLGQLTVDRASGAVSVDVPAGDAVEINGYSIHSPSGLLDPAAWNSLEDQGLEGWGEANPRAEQLSELNPFNSTNAAGTALSLGSAYAGKTTSLSGEDLSFEFSTTEGTVVDGVVNYVGPINDFVLRVDPESGAGQLELRSGNVGPFDLVGYSIFSDAGSLLPDNLAGLGEGWEAGNPTSSALAELNLTGSKLFSTNSTASLGDIFSTTSAADLRFEFATAGGDVLDGSVLYASINGGEMILGDCNNDGVLSAADLSCVTTIPERDAVLASIPALPGDLNGDGAVAFADFLTLSTNFNQNLPEYTSGNINLAGAIDFADFLVLSTNFNMTPGGAAAVPEPSMGLFTMIGLSCLLGVVARKRRGALTAALVGLALVVATSDSALAQVEFDTRMIVLDAANPGPNSQINDTREARDILRGFVTDVNIAEDVTGTVDLIDFAGGPGALPFLNYPYPNGVNDTSLNDFTVQVTGFLEIPEGDWTIGFNTDDGGLISMPRVNFVATGNENGEDGTPGEIIFNGTRGFAWTYGHFTVPAGETLRTEFEAIMFERGGGDGLEVSHIDFFGNGADLAGGFELGDDNFGWKLLADGPAPGDFNWDSSVDFADFLILSANFGTGVSFSQGDFNRDNSVDLHDFVALVPLLTPPAGAATAAVPEPGSLSLLSLAWLGLLLRSRSRHARRE